MIYLTCPPTDERLWPYGNSLIGVMLTPNMRQSAWAPGRTVIWAADNGCFTKGDDFDGLRYLNWLNDRRPFLLKCLFATAPDVVGDPEATWARSEPWFRPLRLLDYRAALCLQDGAEDHERTWDEHESWDTAFIGGSTEWKVSEAAEECIGRARTLGHRVHMGRVNSLKRMRLATSWGCESTDGTYVGFGPDKNLPRVIGWLDELNGHLERSITPISRDDVA